MRVWKRINQTMFHAEEFANTKSDSIKENIFLVGLASVVLALVCAFEVLRLGRSSLTGLPVTNLIEFFGSAPFAATSAFLLVILFSIILLIVGSIFLHLFAFIFGARNGLINTVPAMTIFLVPNLLAGWIPFVNIWTSIYTFLIIVYVLAIKQKISMAKATLAIAIPIIIITLISSIIFPSASKAGMVQSLVPVSFG